MNHFLRTMAMLSALSLLIFAAGCTDENEDAVETDEQALTELVLGDEEIEGVDAWTDDEGGGGLDEPIDPLHWRRFGRRLRGPATVEVVGDTFATITRTITFDGVIRIVTDTANGERTYIEKPMYNTIVRRAHAVRVGSGPRPRRNWRITEVTPDVLVSADPNPQTVNLTRVQVFENAGGEWTELADITDPLNTWFSRGTLPMVTPESEIIVMATVDPALSALGFLHPRVLSSRVNPRLALRDNGVYPDEVRGDGIYSGSYRARGRGVFLVGVDMLDNETLLDSEGAYDAEGWALPYRVVPPQG